MKPALDGWMPIRVFWSEGQPRVDWARLGDIRFTDPFFGETIQRALRHLFHHAFRRQTDIDTLGKWTAERPGLPPAAFIFHMSRCGSTLVCRMLSALAANVVLSEPSPADSILRAHFRNPTIGAGQRSSWLRWMIGALGQRRHPDQRRVFVKFDCWSIAELPVIRQAFPGVPWVFLYRDPLEVLVSQVKRPAGWSIPGSMDPRVLGFDPAELVGLRHPEYCARLLARICDYALAFQRDADGSLLNYTELPEFAWRGLPRLTGWSCTDSDRELMAQAAKQDAKTPGLPFSPDSAAKRNAATDTLRELTDQWLAPRFDQLEAICKPPTRPVL